MNKEVLKFSVSEFPICKSFQAAPEPAATGERLLVSDDLSGIQDFIFNIATDEKVARALKGRSV